jgi:small subunit ribosomal protein S33
VECRRQIRLAGAAAAVTASNTSDCCSTAAAMATAALREASQRIFMSLGRAGHKTGAAHLTKHLNGLVIGDWYPQSYNGLMKRYLGEVWDLEGRRERREEQLGLLRAKGKGPPKKGQGKRAQKKKK